MSTVEPAPQPTSLQLVRDRWYVILESHEIPSGRPIGVTRLGMALVLWRDAGGVLRCTSDRCPHRGAALSLGRVVDGHVECPFHGFRFDGGGACTRIPANGVDGPIPSAMRTPAWEVREANGFVWLWYGDAASDVLVDGDHIRVTYDPATYDAKGFFVELLAPTLWRNRLSANVWAMIAFVPVDATHTRLYLRFYQSYVTLPGLGWLASWASNQFNRHILHQDKRVVLTQEPRQTHLHMGEVLIPSDRPIIEWRRWLKAGIVEVGGGLG